VLLVAYDPAMTAPLDRWLPVSAPLATAWVLSPPRADAPGLASFELELDRAATPSAWPAWLPPHWAVASSAQGLAALALLDAAPGTAHDMAYAGQRLRLRRVEGAAA
jgi:hypothetical protein